MAILFMYGYLLDYLSRIETCDYGAFCSFRSN